MKPIYRLALKVIAVVFVSSIAGQVAAFFAVNDPALVPVLAIPGIAITFAIGWSMADDFRAIFEARGRDNNHEGF